MAVRLPADVELEDRLALGLTGRQLVTLALTGVCAYAVADVGSTVLPLPVAVAAAVLTAAAGGAIAFSQHAGLRGEQLALAFAHFVVAPRRLVLAPDGLPARLPGSPALRLGVLEPPVARILASGLVELPDGSFSVILSARGTSFALRDPEEQAAFASAFGRFLNGLSGPVQILVRRETASLEPQARSLELEAASLPPSLRPLATAHAAYLRELAGASPRLRRRRIFVVLRTHERRPEAAAGSLQRSSTQAAELLRGAGVALVPLAGEEAAALIGKVLEPPGPPPGSQLEGVIHAAPLAPSAEAEPGTAQPRLAFDRG